MVQQISRDDVRKKIDAGEATAVEALPPEYYQDKHLPGAVNLPLDDIDSAAPSLLPDKQAVVITYCTGSTCPNSGIAAKRLSELGYVNVYQYEDGKDDWIAAGLPTESGA